jgi:hypothetical protein
MFIYLLRNASRIQVVSKNALLVCLLLFGLQEVAYCDEEAKALVKGVHDSRVGLSGQLTVKAVYLSLEREKGETLKTYFAGTKRYMECGNYTSIFDGKKLLIYDKQADTNIRDVTDAQGHFCFDVRALGVAEGPYAARSLESVLALDNDAVEYSIVGKEKVNDVDCTRIKILGSGLRVPVERELWIENSENARVHKATYKEPGVHKLVTAIFDEDNRGPIPNQVELVSFDAEGNQRPDSLEIKIDGFTEKKITGKDFGLSALNMKVGTAVCDIRIRRRVGYWNGKSIQEDLPRIPTLPDEKDKSSLPF